MTEKLKIDCCLFNCKYFRNMLDENTFSNKNSFVVLTKREEGLGMRFQIKFNQTNYFLNNIIYSCINGRFQGDIDKMLSS